MCMSSLIWEEGKIVLTLSGYCFIDTGIWKERREKGYVTCLHNNMFTCIQTFVSV